MKLRFYTICKLASSFLLMLAFSSHMSANSDAAVFQVEGGTITTSDNTTVCTSDGVADVVNFSITGAEGPHKLWVVTDESGTILATQPGSAFDFSNAPDGNCVVYHMAFKAFVFPPLAGVNVNALVGWFALSNGITIVRQSNCSGDPGNGGGDTGGGDTGGGDTGGGDTGGGDTGGGDTGGGDTGGETCGANGGSISGGPFTFCVGDGIADNIHDNGVVLSGASGNSAWVVTDESGSTILGLPPTPQAVDFDGAGVATCLLWHLSYEGTLTGAVVGGSVSALSGCISLSNSITISRTDCSPPGNDNTAPNTDGDAVGDRCGVNSGSISLCEGSGVGTNINICTSDGVDSSFDVCVTGNQGGSFWVIIDSDRNLIARQDGFTFDFEGVPAGLCIICHVSFEGEISGLEPGQPVDLVQGCVDFSNEISVTRFVDDPAYCFGVGLVDEPELSFQTIGNPVSDQLRLQISSELSGAHRVVIYDIVGRTLFNNTVAVKEGDTTIDIDATDFDPGIHFINVNNGQKSVMESFVKEGGR